MSKQRMIAICAAMSSIKEKYIVVFEMYEIDEMSYEEISKVVGCPIGTVRSRISRARALLAANI